MAPKITSSRNRSTRKPATPRPVTTSSGRRNRAAVSNARVTNDTSRPNNGSGSARVTSSSGRPNNGGIVRSNRGAVTNTGSASSRPRPSGSLATQGRGPLGGQRVLPPGRRGGAVERSGQTVDVKATTVTDSPGSSRPPTTSPGRPPTTSPNRPPTTSPGRPPVRPSGRFTAPRIPPSQAAIDLAMDAARGGSRLGRALNAAGAAFAFVDQAGRVFNPKDNLLTALNDLRITATNGGRTAPGHTRHPRPQPGDAQSRFANARQENLDRINRDPRFQAPVPRRDNSQPPRSNSGGNSTPPAPPRNRGSGGSSSAAPSRPPAPAPSRPPATQAAPSKPAPPKDEPPTNGVGPVSDGSLYADKLRISGIDKGGPDLERRRAFLDAKDSQAGAKAVRDLLAKRKKRMSE